MAIIYLAKNNPKNSYGDGNFIFPFNRLVDKKTPRDLLMNTLNIIYLRDIFFPNLSGKSLSVFLTLTSSSTPNLPNFSYEKKNRSDAYINVSEKEFIKTYTHEKMTTKDFQDCRYIMIYNKAEGCDREKSYTWKYYWVTNVDYIGEKIYRYTLKLDYWMSEFIEYLVYEKKNKYPFKVDSAHRDRFRIKNKSVIYDFSDSSYYVNYQDKVRKSYITDYVNGDKKWMLYPTNEIIKQYLICEPHTDSGSIFPRYNFGFFIYGVVNYTEKSFKPVFTEQACYPSCLTLVPMTYDFRTRTPNNQYSNWVGNSGNANGVITNFIISPTPFFDWLLTDRVGNVNDVQYNHLNNLSYFLDANKEIYNLSLYKIKQEKISLYTKKSIYEPYLFNKSNFQIRHYDHFGNASFFYLDEILWNEDSDDILEKYVIDCITNVTAPLQTTIYIPTTGSYKIKRFHEQVKKSTDGNIYGYNTSYNNYMNNSKNTFNNNLLNARGDDFLSTLSPTTWVKGVGAAALTDNNEYGRNIISQGRRNTRSLEAFKKDLMESPGSGFSFTNDAYFCFTLLQRYKNNTNREYGLTLDIYTPSKSERIDIVNEAYNLGAYINSNVDFTSFSYWFTNRLRFNYVKGNILHTFGSTELNDFIRDEFNKGVTVYLPINYGDVNSIWKDIENDFIFFEVNVKEWENLEFSVFIEKNDIKNARDFDE